MVLFERDGIIINEKTGDTENVGAECLIDLSTHFVQIEEYQKVAFVHRLVFEYKETWPQAYNSAHEILLMPVAKLTSFTSLPSAFLRIARTLPNCLGLTVEVMLQLQVCIEIFHF
jgi:hypothetical protein